jgi:succinate dehydrogenase/fumarate reductase-like Fe-S protein
VPHQLGQVDFISRVLLHLAARAKLKKYEIETETPMVVNHILRYIQENIGSTLASRNYFCLSGICGSCFVNVNGKRVRGCLTKVNPGEEVVIEPQDGHPIIRDVVTDFGIEV